MKILAILFVTLTFAIHVGAQCNVSAKDAPEIRGFKLGMTVDEAKVRYPHIFYSEDETGYYSTLVNPFMLPDKKGEGISRLDVGFLDGKIVSIIVVYDTSIKWASAEEFAQAVSRSLTLPTTWENKTNPNNPKQEVGLQLHCDGITIGVTPADLSPSGTPIFLLFKNDTKTIRDARRAKAEEQRRRTFKP